MIVVHELLAMGAGKSPTRGYVNMRSDIMSVCVRADQSNISPSSSTRQYSKRPCAVRLPALSPS